MHQKETKETDALLASAWQRGDTAAGETLLYRYMPLIRKTSRQSFAKGYKEDLRQELSLVFLESAKQYSPRQHIPFAAFIEKKIHWATTDWLNHRKAITDHESLDLEAQEEPWYETDMLPSALPDLDTLASLAHLTTKQRRLLPLWLAGKTTHQLCRATGSNQRAMQRLVTRLKDSLHSHAGEISRYLAENN